MGGRGSAASRRDPRPVRISVGGRRGEQERRGQVGDRVGVGRSGRAILEEMTEITGGKAYFPNSVYELEDICTKIAIELKNQYVLGYASTNPAKDGRWRKIKVKLNAPKGLPSLSVRSKTGYFAPTG